MKAKVREAACKLQRILSTCGTENNSEAKLNFRVCPLHDLNALDNETVKRKIEFSDTIIQNIILHCIIFYNSIQINEVCHKHNLPDEQN